MEGRGAVWESWVGFPYPEILVEMARDRFDDAGKLTDATTRDLLADMLKQFAVWVLKVR